MLSTKSSDVDLALSQLDPPSLPNSLLPLNSPPPPKNPNPNQPFPWNTPYFPQYFQKKPPTTFLLLDPMTMRSTLMIPFSQRLERCTLSLQKNKNLASGKICPSNSPQASPFFFVKKKDGGLRPCQDYQYINEHTICNTYPLSLISDLVDKLRDAKVFTKFDVRWGYNNIWIKDGHQWKATFVTHKGLFEATVMFFGLTNSPTTFQQFMNDSF